MATFLIVFLTLYGGLHVYLYAKVGQAFRLAGASRLLFVLFLLLMVLGPVLSHSLDRAGHLGAARVTAFAVYTWMAVILWFTALAAGFDLWNGLLRLAALLWPAAARAVVAPRAVLAVIGIFVMAAGLAGLREAANIRLTRLTIPTSRLRPGDAPLRIVQISDLHLGLLVREKRLRRVVDLIEQAGPDLLVSTGDLVDGEAAHLNHLSDLLAAVRPPLGKYAVAGNHEVYAGLKGSLAFHEAAGFRVLRGETARVGGRLLLAGVDDPAVRQVAGVDTPREAAILPGPEREDFCLLLKHQPAVDEAVTAGFDLQLSGHTHRGQLWPFTLAVRLAHKRVSGFFRLAGDARLYISRGTGTWGPPLRLCSPPEVTLVELVPTEE